MQPTSTRTPPTETVRNAVPSRPRAAGEAAGQARGTSPAPATPPHAGAEAKRRWKYLVAPRYQLPGILAATSAAVLMVVMLNVMSEILTDRFVESVESALPEMQGSLQHEIDRGPRILMIVSSVLFVAGVFFASLVRSHRTWGPVLRIQRVLHTLAAGNYDQKFNLRAHDHLTEITDACNALAEALQVQARREITTLEGCAAAADTLEPEHISQEVAQALRRLAAVKREAIGGVKAEA